MGICVGSASHEIGVPLHSHITSALIACPSLLSCPLALLVDACLPVREWPFGKTKT